MKERTYHADVAESGWFCVTDSTLSSVFMSEAASRWLGIQPGEGCRLLVYLPELAEAILAAQEGDFPLTCAVGVDDPHRQPLVLVVHRLSGSMTGFVFHEKMFSRKQSNQCAQSGSPFSPDIHQLTTLGRLLGGVVHDFNNIFTGILGNIAYLRAVLPLEGDSRESLSSIEEGARRAAALTSALRVVGRPVDDTAVHRSDATTVLRQLGTLLRTIVPPTTSLRVDTPAEPVWMSGLDGLIAEMIVHFTTALLESEQQPSSVRVAMREAFGPVGHSAKLKEAVDRFAVISVAGHWLAERGDVARARLEQSARLRRTVDTLGSLARSVGGWVTSGETSDDAGATAIEIWLPLAGGEGVAVGTPLSVSGATQEKGAGDSLPRGYERVLVMDDEPSVRSVIVMNLQQLGYSVTAVDSGEAALAAYKNATEPFDLVVLDMILPKITGDEVFEAIRQLNPRARILVLSGYSPAGRVQRLLATGGCLFMQKPFAAVDLARRVRECLALPWE